MSGVEKTLVIVFSLVLTDAYGKPVKKVSLPFKQGVPFTVSQGAFGKQSHNEKGNEYNWDLAVPYGTEVVAAEGGKVINVWTPRKGGGCHKKYSEFAHNIKIEHKDGTIAQYVHVDPKVKVGDVVNTSQLIAVTAMNGWICQPHLHFGIYKSKDHLYHSRTRETIPLHFEGIPGSKLVEKRTYVSSKQKKSQD